MVQSLGFIYMNPNPELYSSAFMVQGLSLWFEFRVCVRVRGSGSCLDEMGLKDEIK